MTDAASAQVVDQQPTWFPGPIADLVAMYRRSDADDVVEVVSMEEEDDQCLVVLRVLKR